MSQSVEKKASNHAGRFMDLVDAINAYKDAHDKRGADKLFKSMLLNNGKGRQYVNTKFETRRSATLKLQPKQYCECLKVGDKDGRVQLPSKFLAWLFVNGNSLNLKWEVARSLPKAKRAEPEVPKPKKKSESKSKKIETESKSEVPLELPMKTREQSVQDDQMKDTAVGQPDSVRTEVWKRERDSDESQGPAKKKKKLFSEPNQEGSGPGETDLKHLEEQKKGWGAGAKVSLTWISCYLNNVLPDKLVNGWEKGQCSHLCLNAGQGNAPKKSVCVVSDHLFWESASSNQARANQKCTTQLCHEHHLKTVCECYELHTPSCI
jgi:hypothetical protein